MSVFHTAEDPDMYEFEDILPKIARTPDHHEEHFQPDKALFENLRSHETVTYSCQDFMLVNLLGPYPTPAAVPDNVIACVYPEVENLYFSTLHLSGAVSTCFSHPDLPLISIPNILTVTPDNISSQFSKIAAPVHLTKKQIQLLSHLKMVLQLEYLVLPSSFPDRAEGEVQEDSWVTVDGILAEEVGSTLSNLQKDIERLSEFGLLVCVSIEGVEYVVNLTKALKNSEGKNKMILMALGIPAAQEIQPLKLAACEVGYFQ